MRVSGPGEPEAASERRARSWVGWGGGGGGPALIVLECVSLGAGSILSFLRPATTVVEGRQLVLVPNATLMDSHQADLADELAARGWAAVCTPEQAPAPLPVSPPNTRTELTQVDGPILILPAGR